ncbi:MAG: hypothetical protein AAGD10_03515 [Myxococcota bacterium]
MTGQLLVPAPEYGLYSVFLSQLWSMSRALDKALNGHDLSLLRKGSDSRFSDRLETELKSIGGGPSPLMSATRAITDRIAQVEKEEPLLLLAHDFARASRDPNGVGATGQLARLILDRREGEGRVGYLPDPFEPFFDALERIDLPPLLRRRLREEGVRAQGLNLRFVREVHQTYVAQ